MGGIEKSIALQAIRSGNPIPDRIANAPELEQGLDLYLFAFFDLDTTRPVSGMGMAPISWLAIKQYADLLNLDAEQSDTLFYVVREMDGAYLSKNKPKPKPTTKAKKR